jgi:PhoH-like ATPase
MTKGKIYILDTNVLLHDPLSLFSFENSHIAIPIMVLEELDHFKAEQSLRGRNTREVIRHLDALRDSGSFATSVPLSNGGSLQILFKDSQEGVNFDSLDSRKTDNNILFAALDLKQKGWDVRLITKDLNMRVKADAMGIAAVDYLKDTIVQEEFYKGWLTIQAPSVQLKKDVPDILLHLQEKYTLTVNEFIIIESQHNPHNKKVFRYTGDNNFIHVNPPHLKWPIEPRNVQQLMTLDLLLDNSIQLVTLLGPAGTGKTFLALVAALHEMLIKEEYEKVLITRPVIPLGPDIGFLPGDIHEKLHSWMQPIYDNMDFIVHLANTMMHAASTMYHEEEPERYDRRAKNHKKLSREKNIPTLDDLLRRGKISLDPITYMRGRSIPYQYIFIDEAQNLSLHEVKTLISRVGEGSKIILAGDPYQIDSPYLDFNNNGLVVASQRFKGQKLFGTIFLETSERSELSRLAGKLL